MFKSHMEGALAAGLDVGVYFFSQAVDKEEAYEEAQFVLERIRPYAVTYPVVFDTEEIKNEEARTCLLYTSVDSSAEEQIASSADLFNIFNYLPISWSKDLNVYPISSHLVSNSSRISALVLEVL